MLSLSPVVLTFPVFLYSILYIFYINDSWFINNRLKEEFSLKKRMVDYIEFQPISLEELY